MSKLITSCVLFFFLVWLKSLIAAYNVVDFGARPDGQTDSTSPFLRAWMAACSSVGTATIYVPFGTFLIKPIIFSGPCKNRVIFKIDGTLVAPQNYRALGNSGCWILFREVSMVSIRGGTIDARGAGFWECRKSGRNCPVGAKSIMFLGSNKIIISGLKSLNSQNIHIAIDHCNNLLIEDVRITAPSESPNTDGINVQASSGVTIRNNTIMTGDDCIAIGPGSRHLWMEKIACGPGHGISVGSLGHSLQEDGVWNVTVTGAVFTKTQNGVRIKSWGRPSSGYATDIHFRNIKMIGVSNPIIIDQKYCPDNKCPHQTSGVKVSEVTYSNINGTSATEAAVIFECSFSNPCTGISLQDIKLSHFNKQATAYCNNARGISTGIVIPNSCLWK